MKKVMRYMLMALVCTFCAVAYTGCESEPANEESYVGESELDYKPANYTISVTWDFSGAPNLTAAEKAELKKEGDGEVTKRYDTRKQATAVFDALVVELQSYEVPKEAKGMKCTIRLWRGADLCKKAVLRW